MKLTQEQIQKINKECPYDQGIFNEPFGIPNNVKGLVIYGRYESGGVSGGSCWDSSNPQPYYRESPPDRMKVLDLVLREINPNISVLDYRLISGLIQSSTDTDWEYYGNHTDYVVEYVLLEELYQTLEKLGY